MRSQESSKYDTTILTPLIPYLNGEAKNICQYFLESFKYWNKHTYTFLLYMTCKILMNSNTDYNSGKGHFTT